MGAKRGYIVYKEKFHTSPDLFYHLMTDGQTVAEGALQTRNGIPKEFPIVKLNISVNIKL